MSINETMLEAIKARQQKRSEFGYGIVTADQYVSTLQDVVGLDVCYHYASKGQTSFADALQKAANTLVYSNPDMVVEAKDAASMKRLQKRFDFPKNTLMAFQHVLTTPKKDRDGDIMRTEGAIPDPRMLLLWQHVPTLPIGKMVGIVKHTKRLLSLVSAIVDMNDLSHDAAVMVDNGMGRFSHGFHALEFEEMKGSDGEVSGFDVKSFEIMEESLVSVPSNTDADTQEVFMSLVEGGKLTSPLMKRYGKSIREHWPKSMPVEIDLTVKLNGEEIEHGLSNRSVETESGEAGGGVGTPTKENESAGTAATEAEVAKDAEGGEPSDEVTEEKKETVVIETEKAGRALSKGNEDRIREAVGAITDVLAMDIPRPAKATLREATAGLEQVLKILETDEEETKQSETSVKDAITTILFQSTKEERLRLKEALAVVEMNERQKEAAKQLKSLLGT